MIQKSRLFAPLVRMGRPTEPLPLAQSLHCTGAAISASVPTRSLSFSNTVRPPSHAAAFINASIYPKSIEKVTEKGHARVSETLSPLVFPAREIKDLESRLRCRTRTSVLRDAKGRVCIGIFLGSCRPSFFQRVSKGPPSFLVSESLGSRPVLRLSCIALHFASPPTLL